MTRWQGRIPLFLAVAGQRALDAQQQDDCERQIRGFLAGLRQELPTTPIVVLSRFAGDADQLVASVALAVGCELACVLPMEVAPYRATFASDSSRGAFDRLLGASVVLSLAGAGHPTDPDRAYAEAGRFLARHATLVLAVWDGVGSQRPGGVADVLKWRATGWIGSADPTICELRVHAGQPAEAVPGSNSLNPRKAIEACGWRSAEKFNAAVLSAARAELTHVPEPFAALSDERVGEVATVARAAGLSAAQVRSALSRRRLLLQSIAFCAAIAFAMYLKLGAHHWVLWLYLGLLGSALSVRALVRHEDLHHRFLDYRSLAEGLRVLLFWRIAGVLRDVTVSRPDAAFGWVGAAINGLDGWVGCAPLAGMDGCEFAARHWLGAQSGADPRAQIPYYRAAASRLRRLAKRVDRIVSFTLITGVVSAALLAILPAVWRGSATPVLTTIMGLMPLISGTASAALDVPAEQEMARQYEHMQRLLETAARRLADAESGAERRQILFEVGTAALAEQRIWHAVFGQRPQEGRSRG